MTKQINETRHEFTLLPTNALPYTMIVKCRLHAKNESMKYDVYIMNNHKTIANFIYNNDK